MRALKAERLVARSRLRRGKAAPKARAKPAPRRRRKPPPRWRRPALLGAAWTLAVTLLAAGALWMWRADYPGIALAWAGRVSDQVQIGAGLKVDEMILRGRRRTPREDVLRALAIPRGAPILSLDLDAVRERLEAVGWVRSAGVARRLPDTLDVRITEYIPLALWQRRGKLVLIAGDGTPITDSGLEKFGHLPIVVGEDAAEHAAALLAVLKRENALWSRVEAAIRVGARRWNIRLAGGVEVRLPEDKEAQAWTRLAALDRDHRILSRAVVAIDMRLPDRLVVRLAPESAARFRDPGEKT